MISLGSNTLLLDNLVSAKGERIENCVAFTQRRVVSTQRVPQHVKAVSFPKRQFKRQVCECDKSRYSSPQSDLQACVM